MSQSSMKKIRREFKDKRPSSISKKEFHKIDYPSKKQKKLYQEWKDIYKTLKRKYKSLQGKERMEAWV